MVVEMLLSRRAAVETANENGAGLGFRWLGPPKGSVPGPFEPPLGGTALHLAAEMGRSQMVELLRAVGASTDAKDRDGKTPADVAEAKGHKEVVVLLRACNSAPRAFKCSGHGRVRCRKLWRQSGKSEGQGACRSFLLWQMAWAGGEKRRAEEP